MTIEHSIEGVWKMYNNNSGLIDVEKNAFVHAFSHFSYDYSQGNILFLFVVITFFDARNE